MSSVSISSRHAASTPTPETQMCFKRPTDFAKHTHTDPQVVPRGQQRPYMSVLVSFDTACFLRQFFGFQEPTKSYLYILFLYPTLSSSPYYAHVLRLLHCFKVLPQFPGVANLKLNCAVDDVDVLLANSSRICPAFKKNRPTNRFQFCRSFQEKDEKNAHANARRRIPSSFCGILRAIAGHALPTKSKARCDLNAKLAIFVCAAKET